MENQYEECPVCLESKPLVKSLCKHKICYPCLGNLLSLSCDIEKQCPICKTNYTINEILTYNKVKTNHVRM